MNGEFAARSPLKANDILSVGTFTLQVHEQPTTRSIAAKSISDSSSTFVRSIADFNRDFNLEATGTGITDVGGTLAGRRHPPEKAREKIFEILVQVARTLIEAPDVDQILSKVVDLLFDFLPAERAVVVLREDGDRLVATLARQRGRAGPEAAETFSHTIVETVVRERVAVLTSDALTDGRFEAGQSIRIQQIRSAMCVPLWNRENVIGALHVDTPLKTGTFTADDLDLLTALGNFAAVAIERARLQGRVAREERIRERLARYHSPGVVEEIVSEEPSGVEKVRTRDVSVFFADIVGFSTSAEEMAPDELSRFLETVFTFAADAIFEQGGTLDKFIGDAVMAFFGAPIAQPDHPRRAVAAAAKLIESLTAWNAERAGRGEPRVAVRVGVNTGRAVVGDIGSDRRVDYTGPREHRERGGAARGLRRGPERDRRRRGDGPARGRFVRARTPRRAAPQGPHEGPESLSREARREGRAGSPAVRDPLTSLTFVTSNAGKAREAAAFLGREVALKEVEIPEIQSLDFAEVARAKAIVAAGALGVPVLVEDSGLAVDAWGGFPGPLTKWVTAGLAGCDAFAKMLDGFTDRSAEAVSVLAVARPGQRAHDVVVAEGRVRGSIALHPRGTNGFGWDVLFIPEGATRTWAEISEEEKNRDSHRARAFKTLRTLLQLGRSEERPA